MSIDWTDVHDDFDSDGNLIGDTQRRKVPNGYLYRTRILNSDGWQAVALCFVPYVDPSDLIP
jgi:hypothetical protein